MALINRITRLFRADMHAVLDRIEEPDVLLRQAVREMEEEILQQEQRLRLLDSERQHLDKRETELKQSLAQLDDELNICFDAGKDELAHTLIRRKLETQGLHKLLLRKRESLAEEIDALQQQLQQHRQRFEAMRQKLELLVRDKSALQDDDYGSQPELRVSDEDVEVAFLREKQQRRST